MFGWAPPPKRPPALLLPPRPAPQLDEQHLDLVEHRLRLERQNRLAFSVLDRMRTLFGEEIEPRHVCPIPPPIEESAWAKAWQCEECGQCWLKPPWYSGWTTVSHETYKKHVP